MARIVGMIYGEVGDSKINFLVSKQSKLQKGGYVKVNHENYGWVLAQVASIRRYNEHYSLNAITNNKTINSENTDRVIAKAKVIGYQDNKGFLRNPRIPFRPGEKVVEANSSIIRRNLNLGIKSGIYLGLLDGHKEEVPVYLNINKLVQKHACVLAKTGAGKSYTVGVLIEELIEKKVPVVIIDPHGEYSALKNPNTNPKERGLMRKYGISPKGYEKIIEYTPDKTLNPQADRKLSLDISRLTIANFLEMLPTKVSDTQKGILFETITEAKKHGRFGIKNLIEIIQEHKSKAKWNLITNLEMLKESKIFEGNPISPSDIVKKGMVSIINLRGVRPDIQEIIVTRISNEIFQDRKRGKVPPLFFLLEEAHNFAPERGFGKSSALGITRTIASEGRKFGMGLCVVSQRPARVDKSVLSQCNTQIILKVTNPNDLKAISQSIEGFTSDLEEEIMQLQPGVGLIVGDVVEQPIFVDIRVKKSRHGGGSVEVVRDRRPRLVPTPAGILKNIFSR